MLRGEWRRTGEELFNVGIGEAARVELGVGFGRAAQRGGTLALDVREEAKRRQGDKQNKTEKRVVGRDELRRLTKNYGPDSTVLRDEDCVKDARVK